MEQVIGRQTLIGIAMPNFQDKIQTLVDSWKPYLADPSRAIDLDNLVYIEFKNKRGDKVKIYRDLVRAFDRGWFKLSMIDLARYLAMHTNLATNPDVDQRTDTIYHFLKKYKNTFVCAA